eukprot:CAMPEP_0196599236 /NCGR_PEP_ID=MMETSP1081-20130531/94752_1 /TAXON_ID=36882 /ORGANISM="Pyramimonas amylifera, Strain CCMP720" /LENGTH=195 /DNA_ID=CAMNT_0041924997 /DNA_START=64 /DNA_END=651 /DNA_ORIENTATION=-
MKTWGAVHTRIVNCRDTVFEEMSKFMCEAIPKADVINILLVAKPVLALVPPSYVAQSPVELSILYMWAEVTVRLLEWQVVLRMVSTLHSSKPADAPLDANDINKVKSKFPKLPREMYNAVQNRLDGPSGGPEDPFGSTSTSKPNKLSKSASLNKSTKQLNRSESVSQNPKTPGMKNSSNDQNSNSPTVSPWGDES